MKDIKLIPEKFKFSEKETLTQIEKDLFFLHFLITGKKLATAFSKLPLSYFQKDKDILINNSALKIRRYDIVTKEYNLEALNINETISELEKLNFCKFYWNYCVLKTYLLILEKYKKKINPRFIPKVKVLEKLRAIFEEILLIEKDIVTICEYKNIMGTYKNITKYGLANSGAINEYINSII